VKGGGEHKTKEGRRSIDPRYVLSKVERGENDEKVKVVDFGDVGGGSGVVGRCP